MPNIWMLHTSDKYAEQQLDSVHLKLALLIYDLLNDDDGEIRGIAADIAATLLSSRRSSPGTTSTYQAKKTVALLASQHLLAHVFTNYAHHPQLLEQALLRTTGLDRHHTAAAAFLTATINDTALFAVEKQNLFIDSVREAVLWSQVLKRLPLDTILRSRSFSSVLRRLSKWMREALDLVREKLTGERGEDGVLSWTSKPDMFVFGMRLWCVVDLAFSWRRKVGRASDKLLQEMVEILRWGRERNLHPLWMAKIEKVVVREIRERLRGGEAGRKVNALAAMVDAFVPTS